MAAPLLDGADTALWAATSPELEGITGKFWSKRHEVRCRFRDPAEIQKLLAIVEQQLAHESPIGAGLYSAAPSRPPKQTVQ